MNPMYIDWNAIITAGAVLGAGGVILGFVLKGYKRAIKPDENAEQIEELKRHHEEDMHRIKEENYLICYALSACLDGLMQQGCNHTVPDAKKKLDEYLNKQAHE